MKMQITCTALVVIGSHKVACCSFRSFGNEWQFKTYL